MNDYTARARRLADMLTYRRVSRSTGEEGFIAEYIDCVPGMQADSYGNRWIQIGNTETLFSCHTDTVHRDNGAHNPRQTIQADAVMSRFFKEVGSGCLGADDGVGVFIMLEMIEAEIPGLYIFHREEETGGGGSSFIATDPGWELLLGTMKRAVAFDRRGTDSVITHQGFERGCSDAFGNALCDALGMGHILDDSGSFTDTANYFSLIPECTNISAGYENEHTDKEYLDVGYVIRLADAVKKVKWEELPTAQSIDNRENMWGNSIWNGHTAKKPKLSLDSVWAIKEMDCDMLKEFLEFCRIDDSDLDDYLYDLTTSSSGLEF